MLAELIKSFYSKLCAKVHEVISSTQLLSNANMNVNLGNALYWRNNWYKRLSYCYNSSDHWLINVVCSWQNTGESLLTFVADVTLVIVRVCTYFTSAYFVSCRVNMVQLSSKVTFTCVPDVSCTCFRHVLHVFRTCPCLAKRGMALTLAAALSQAFVLAWTCLVCVPDASCMHFRCISHTFQTHSNVTLELSCTILISLLLVGDYLLARKLCVGLE